VTSKPKQIIIDKSAFQGIRLDSLCDFAKHHFLLVSDSLLYECATADKNKRQDPADLLAKYEGVIKGGACYCSMSREYIEWEAKNSNPYPPQLADASRTESMLAQAASLEDLSNPAIIRRAKDSRWLTAKRMYPQMSMKLSERMKSEHPQGTMEIKRLPSDRVARLQEWFKGIDESTIVREIALKGIPSMWIKDRAKFCTSPEWMAWQWVRIDLAIQRDYVYARLMGGARADWRAEHDAQDAEYVLLLSRADALLSRDKGVCDLARAAFPGKDVFSSLDEVPESYRCDWA